MPWKWNTPGCPCCEPECADEFRCSSLSGPRSFSGYFLNPPSAPQWFSTMLYLIDARLWLGTVNTKGMTTSGLNAPAFIYLSCSDDTLSVWYRMGIVATIFGCRFATNENPYGGWTGEITGGLNTVDTCPFLATGTWPDTDWNETPGCPHYPAPQLTGGWAIT